MAKQFTLGRYLIGDGFLHHLDGRLKVVATFFLTVVSFWAANWPGLGLLLGLLVALWAGAGLPLENLDQNLRPVWWLLIFTLVFHLFGDPGPYTHLGPLTLSLPGLDTGGLFSLRLIFLVEMTALLTLTTSPLELTDALEDLFSPLARFRVPVWDLALMISIALRFVPVFWDEAEKIKRAQISRGADFDTRRPLKLAQVLLPLLVPLFASAFRRAEELALAMEARGYQAGTRRTRLRENRWGRGESLSLLGLLLLLPLLWYLREGF